MTDSSTSDTDQWTVERLIEFAQTMDQSYHQFGNDGILNRRKFAFDARKLARTKQRLEADMEQS